MEINKIGSAMSVYKKIGNDYKAGVKKSPGTSAKRDTFEISPAARASIDAAKSAARELAGSDASAERLATLKSSIENGSYNVSAESVATSILEG